MNAEVADRSPTPQVDPDPSDLSSEPVRDPGQDRATAPASTRRPTPLWRRRWVRWLVAGLVVLVLVLVAASVVTGTVGAQTGDDPSSVTGTGSAAVAQLLRDQGVDLTRTEDVDQATVAATGATVLIVHPERLSRDALLRLTAADPTTLVLVRPTIATLELLGVPLPAGATTGSPDGGAIVSPGCTQPDAARAGSILLPADSLSYPLLPGATSCYPDLAGGAVFEQVRARGQLIDILGTGLANETLAQQGNAALATDLLGGRPRLVWLMARNQQTSVQAPGLLPRWWTMLGVQAAIGVVLLGLWQGRRLGPIISERLPVVVRAGETVEGHGRLYYRLSARDRAAAALRAGVCRRLGPRFGQTQDLPALAAVLAARTGRDPVQVQAWLNGPAPTDDEQLCQLARDLDQLEQEARQL